MIFKEELVEKILRGEKTVTRRPVKYGEADDGSCEVFALPCKYKVGRDYALQGPPEKGSKARARTIPGYRLKILSVIERIIPTLISHDDARREGFETPEQFIDYLRGLYGGHLPEEVHRIEFEPVRTAERRKR